MIKLERDSRVGFDEIKNSVSYEYARGSTSTERLTEAAGGLSVGARTLPTKLACTLVLELVLMTFTWPIDNTNNLSLAKQCVVIYNGNWHSSCNVQWLFLKQLLWLCWNYFLSIKYRFQFSRVLKNNIYTLNNKYSRYCTQYTVHNLRGFHLWDHSFDLNLRYFGIFSN